MNSLTKISLHLCLWIGFLGAGQPLLSQQTGTLVFDMKPYTSTAKMPDKSQKAIEHAGIRWGIEDNTLLIALVNQNFVNADLPYLTRFGEQKTLTMKPGDYTITCIGWEFDSTSADPSKNLAKSAFFNNDIVKFTVLPGKTTTLELTPVYKQESQWHVLAKFTLLVPDFKT